MTQIKRARNWMRIETRVIPGPQNIAHRPVSIDDAPALAILMDRSYQGTVDHEGETLEQCVEEILGTLTGKYGPFLDFASFAVFEGERAVSASLVTRWMDKPLVAFSMTDPSMQGRGYAWHLIERSISTLAEMGYPELYLVVTEGNTPAEHLYISLGFENLGPAAPKQPPPSPG